MSLSDENLQGSEGQQADASPLSEQNPIIGWEQGRMGLVDPRYYVRKSNNHLSWIESATTQSEATKKIIGIETQYIAWVKDVRLARHLMQRICSRVKDEDKEKWNLFVTEIWVSSFADFFRIEGIEIDDKVVSPLSRLNEDLINFAKDKQGIRLKDLSIQKKEDKWEIIEKEGRVGGALYGKDGLHVYNCALYTLKRVRDLLQGMSQPPHSEAQRITDFEEGNSIYIDCFSKGLIVGITDYLLFIEALKKRMNTQDLVTRLNQQMGFASVLYVTDTEEEKEAVISPHLLKYFEEYFKKRNEFPKIYIVDEGIVGGLTACTVMKHLVDRFGESIRKNIIFFIAEVPWNNLPGTTSWQNSLTQEIKDCN